jgi:hypothetical protein
MKKLLKTSAVYAFVALACGVFDREFTKAYAFTGLTPLRYVHVHFFVLGMFLFLILALFAKDSALTEKKTFRAFFLVYDIALPWTGILMLIRGILAVLGTELSASSDTLLSVFAGLGHLGLTAGFVLLFLSLFRTFTEKKALPQEKA